MHSLHAWIAEPTVLATARPQDGTGVMAVGVARRGVVASVPAVRPGSRMGAAWCTPTACSTDGTTRASFPSRERKPLAGHGALHIGGGLRDRIEVRPA